MDAFRLEHLRPRDWRRILSSDAVSGRRRVRHRLRAALRAEPADTRPCSDCGDPAHFTFGDVRLCGPCDLERCDHGDCPTCHP